MSNVVQVVLRRLTRDPIKEDGLRGLITHVHHVSVRFESCSGLIVQEKRMTALLVYSLPQGLEVPAEKLHTHTVKHERIVGHGVASYQRTTTKSSYIE